MLIASSKRKTHSVLAPANRTQRKLLGTGYRHVQCSPVFTVSMSLGNGSPAYMKGNLYKQARFIICFHTVDWEYFWEVVFNYIVVLPYYLVTTGPNMFCILSYGFKLQINMQKWMVVWSTAGPCGQLMQVAAVAEWEGLEGVADSGCLSLWVCYRLPPICCNPKYFPLTWVRKQIISLLTEVLVHCF